MINNLQQNIHAIIRAGNEKGYVAKCVEISVITQGMTLYEVSKNLVEAVSLHLEDENLSELDFVSNPSLVFTVELQPEYA